MPTETLQKAALDRLFRFRMVNDMMDAAASNECPNEFDITESNVRYYCRNMSSVFVRAMNAQIWDENQNEYIDFLSACGSLNYGHNHPLMKAALIEYLANDGPLNSLDLHTDAKRAFLRAFRKTILAPRGLNYRVQFTGPTGANAVEAAIKLARKITGRRSVVAFTNAFHGMSLGALAASGRNHHLCPLGVGLDGVARLPYDGYLGAGLPELDRYEGMVKDPSGGTEPPAAFIIETIQGEGGLNAARAEWLAHIVGMARRLGALVIIDDVQAGCGRTGDFFSFEMAGIIPDLVCLAKSISGCGLPMALVLIKDEYDRWAPGEHNGTFRGNNLAFVTATIAVQLWQDQKFTDGLTQASDRIRNWSNDVVAEFGSDRIKRKGRGLFCGLIFADHKIASLAAAEAFRRRLLIETCGPYDEVLKILPALTIEPELLERGLLLLREAIESAFCSGRLQVAA